MITKKEKIGTCSASLNTEFEQEINTVLAEGAEILDVKIIENKNSPSGRIYCAVYSFDTTFGKELGEQKPVLLVPVLNAIRGDLCREFLDLCKEHPEIEFTKVPGAPEKADEIDKYDAFVLKYFHHKWNQDRYTYEQVEE